MTREEAKDMFNMDRDSYGKIKGVTKKIDKIYDDFESRTCKWKGDEDNIYATQCKNMFEISNDSTPQENEFKFCCYCGGKIT